MGQSDEDIDKIQAAGISKTQQYKLAGNSIVVPVLEAVFRGMYIDQTWEPIPPSIEQYGGSEGSDPGEVSE